MPEVTGSLKCRTFKLDVVGHVYNPNIHEAEAGGLPLSPDQPGLHSKIQDTLSYGMRLCLKKKKKMKRRKTKMRGVNRG